MIALDIETRPIIKYSPKLPEPVGCAIDGHYYAWGHPTENNCTRDEFVEVLHEVWGQEWITHNGLSFDVPVLAHWFKMPKRDPLLTHDTLLLAYLHNPHFQELGLKWLAQRVLTLPPDDQDAMNQWILEHTDCKTVSKCGEYIYKAPGDIVGRYAVADAEMTRALYNYLHPLVLPKMVEAYDRERTLAPILVDLQVAGVRCDTERLRNDYINTVIERGRLEEVIRTRLNSPYLEITKDAQLIAALQEQGFTNFLLTDKTKALSASGPSIAKACVDDPELVALLKRFANVNTLSGTFMHAWLLAANENGNMIHASYNQVRNPDGFGTRTGRLSSTNPNFGNIPNDLGSDLPKMRSYLLPDEGMVWVTADIKNQEPRVAAHFEDGALCAAFKADNTLDPYRFVMAAAGIERKQAKVVLLGLLYSMGAGMLADRLGVEVFEATKLRDVVKSALPDIVELDFQCKHRWNAGHHIKTLGGRIVYCEPPSVDKEGRRRTWEYKALNYLVQGSAADQTKQMLIYVHQHLAPGERILGTVYDEVSVCCTPERVEAVSKILLDGANALKCDVPMLVSVNVGANFSKSSK